MTTLKILLIGPAQAGKSAIAHYLSERKEVHDSIYRPTNGVRIQILEKEAPKHPKHTVQEQIVVELWDVSGDLKYEHCWPAVQKGAHGIMLVYNPENPKHETEIEKWISAFPKKMGMPANLIIGLAHHVSGNQFKGKTRPPASMSSLQMYDTSIEEAASSLGPAFDKFFNSIVLNMFDRQEKEENRIME